MSDIPKIMWAVTWKDGRADRGELDYRRVLRDARQTTLTHTDILMDLTTRFAARDQSDMPDWLFVRVLWPNNGEGSIRHYKRDGIMWRQTYGDNVLPDWFPWAMLGMVVGMALLFYIIGNYLL